MPSQTASHQPGNSLTSYTMLKNILLLFVLVNGAAATIRDYSDG